MSSAARVGPPPQPQLPAAPGAPALAAAPAAFRFLHPCNLLTYVSLGAGALAMLSARGASAGHAALPAAGMLLALAVLADSLDGRFAALFHRTAAARAFGVQLDSLSDAVALGAAPVLVLASALPPLPLATATAWYTAGLAYLLAAVTRLGVYNTVHESDGFTGMPTPLAALICATALLARPAPAASAAVLLLSAALMLAPLRIPRPRPLAFLAFLAWALAVALLHSTR